MGESEGSVRSAHGSAPSEGTWAPMMLCRSTCHTAVTAVLHTELYALNIKSFVCCLSTTNCQTIARPPICIRRQVSKLSEYPPGFPYWTLSWPRRRSLFTEQPVKMKVGCKGKIYYVHPGVFAPFSSSALYARIHGPWKDTGNEIIDLTEFEEQTIECAMSFFYTRDYYPFQVTSNSDPELGNETKNVDWKSTRREENQDNSPTDGKKNLVPSLNYIDRCLHTSQLPQGPLFINPWPMTLFPGRWPPYKILLSRVHQRQLNVLWPSHMILLKIVINFSPWKFWFMPKYILSHTNIWSQT